MPMMKEVDTVLSGPVKNKPILFNWLKPTYCCHTNPIPNNKAMTTNNKDNCLLLFFKNFCEKISYTLLATIKKVLT